MLNYEENERALKELFRTSRLCRTRFRGYICAKLSSVMIGEEKLGDSFDQK